MSATALLPNNATALERAIEQSAAVRLAALPAVVARLWNADTCPAVLLPWLAWSLSVDEWDGGWSEDIKRAAIRAAYDVHAHKGTLWAIKRALAALGQPDAAIVERGDYVKRNGVAVRNAVHRRLGIGGWATYRVVLRQAVTIDQAHQIKRLLAAVQRHCVELTAIDYREAAIRRNGAASRNAVYSRGVVDTSLN